MNFNLIISTFRHREEEAYNEILDILSDAGDLEAQAVVSDIVGIILGFTRIDPFQVIQILHKLMIDNPWEIRYILRLLPIETLGKGDPKVKVPALLDKVVKAMTNAS